MRTKYVYDNKKQSQYIEAKKTERLETCYFVAFLAIGVIGYIVLGSAY